MNMIRKCLGDKDMEAEYQVCPKLMDSMLQNCKDYQQEVCVRVCVCVC